MVKVVNHSTKKSDKYNSIYFRGIEPVISIHFKDKKQEK